MPEIAVITGGSAGIGRATAMAFARAGYWVGVLARDPDRVNAVCEAIRNAGGHALGVPTDVSDAAEVERAADLIERELGVISVWVNNASTSVFARVLDMTAEEYRQVMAVTYLGAVHGTMAALKRMHPRDRGVIVQTGSALAYRSIPLQSAYCAGKAAIRGFTDALRSELIHDRSHVRLTMVQLSAFNTPQFDWVRSRLPRRLQPVPPIFQPEIAADAILWAAGHHPRELWVGWPAVKTILSARLLPGLGDRLAAHNAYESQQTEEPAQPDRPDNLFVPVVGDFGAHGRFDARADSSSAHWFLSKHRWRIATLVLIALAAVGIPAFLIAPGRAVRGFFVLTAGIHGAPPRSSPRYRYCVGFFLSASCCFIISRHFFIIASCSAADIWPMSLPFIMSSQCFFIWASSIWCVLLGGVGGFSSAAHSVDDPMSNNEDKPMLTMRVVMSISQ